MHLKRGDQRLVFIARSPLFLEMKSGATGLRDVIMQP